MTEKPSRFYDIDDDTLTSDVGSQPGTAWTLSSFKPGSGVDELRSADMSKLWQSDGSQPHLVNIQFARRTLVSHVSIFLDVKSDDSYTPTRIAVKAGTNYHDLVLVRERTFDTPQGWKHFLLDKMDSTAEEEEDAQDEQQAAPSSRTREGIHVWMIQICVLANHLNGKDTHIRRIMVFGPTANQDDAPIHKRMAVDRPLSERAQTMPRGDGEEEAQTKLYLGMRSGADVNTQPTQRDARTVTFGLADLLGRHRIPPADQDEETDVPLRRNALSLLGSIR